MDLQSSLKKRLAEIFDTHERVCLWFSAGADSRLLLETMLSLGRNFAVLNFEDGFSRKQREIVNQVIKEKNLQVFSYPPQTAMLVGFGENLSLAAFYAIDETANNAPVLRDLVTGETCAFDIPVKSGQKHAPIVFDAHIWGTRGDDTHSAVKGQLAEKRWKTGEKYFYAPLFDWKRKDVLNGLKSFGIDYTEPPDDLNTGNIACCALCLKEETDVFCPKQKKIIPSVKWDKQKNNEVFEKLLKGE